MSDDVEDFDMEIVEEDELDELGAGGSSSSEERTRAESREDTFESEDPETEVVETGEGSPSDLGRTYDSGTKASEDGGDQSPRKRPRKEEGDSSADTTLRSIPDEWEVRRLGDDFDIEYGDERAPDELGDYPLYGANGVIGRTDEYLFEDPVVTVGARGAVANVHLTEPGSWVTNNSLVLLDRTEVNRYFLANALRYFSVERAVTGSAQPQITSGMLGKMEYPSPSLREQRKIASVLYAVDQAIQKTEAIIQQAQRVKRGLMQDLWTYGLDGISDSHGQEESSEALQETTVGRFPEDWEIVNLDSVAERITDGSHQAVETLPDGQEGIPFLYVSCIRDGQINWDKASSVSEEVYEDISEGKKPKAGVILYTAVGSYGHAVMLEGDERLSFQRHIAYIRPDESAISPRFLAHWLDSVRAKKYADRVAQGNAQKTVTLHDLSRYPVPLPDRESQVEIAGFLDRIDDRVQTERDVSEGLRRLKKGLMQDLLTGEVRTADKAIEVLEEVKTHG
jgi:type I restriction enzyme S subunit